MYDAARRTVGTSAAIPLRRTIAISFFAILRSLSKLTAKLLLLLLLLIVGIAPRGAYALPRIMNNSNNDIVGQQPPPPPSSSSFLLATQPTMMAPNNSEHDVDATTAETETTPSTTAADNDNAPSSPFILVIGASGGTGLRVLAGLLDVGFAPSQIRLLTRNVNKPTSMALRQYGFQLVQGDLDIPSTLAPAFSSSLSGIYVHSTTGDMKTLDTGEVDRARNLALAIRTYYQSSLSTTTATTTAATSSSLQQQPSRGLIVVYNSSAAEKNHAGNVPRRALQKHEVEMVFRRELLGNKNDATATSGEDLHVNDGGGSGGGCASFVSLRANLFMEDFWKKYTRPSILDAGKFPFSIPPDRKLHLTSVRDMGRLAGTILMSQHHHRQEEQSPSSSSSNDNANDDYYYEVINVASDVLTPPEMAATFAKVQNSPCVHTRNHFFALLVRFFFKDLHEIIHFYRTSTELTDVMELKRRFPGEGLLTSFEEFLVETNWSNRELTYENYWTMDIVAQHCSGSTTSSCGSSDDSATCGAKEGEEESS